MLNARIRKIFAQKGITLFSIGHPGDRTYDYKIIGEKTDDIEDLINKKSKFSEKFLSSKKPIVIIGESALEMKSGKYIFEEIKDFLKKNRFISKEWNALNVLPQNASTVGLIDLNIFPNEKSDFSFFDKIEKNEYEILYLLGSDNLNIKKNNEFIIYQGSHGDKGAEIADVILPSAAYTEQSGLYENLEGRIQECKKASYPIGEAKEDWKIFNSIIKQLNRREEILKFDNLRKESLGKIKNFSALNELPNFSLKELKYNKQPFLSERIKVNELNYYFSNSISRASKTMSDCHEARRKSKKQELIIND